MDSYQQKHVKLLKLKQKNNMEEALKSQIRQSKGLAIISWICVILIIVLSSKKTEVLAALPLILVAAVVFTIGTALMTKKLKEYQKEKETDENN